MFDSLRCANESGISDVAVATGLHVVFPLLRSVSCFVLSEMT